MESVDGRIDCAMTEQIEQSNVYYDALNTLGCPSQLMGRVTMQIHYADVEPFRVQDTTPVGKEAFHSAIKANGYAVGLDTYGTLAWSRNEVDGLPLLIVTSENCPNEYLDTLTSKGISWIATGSDRIDLARAMEMLNTRFDIERLVLVGGGHINGAFLAARLLDEISVMIGPGIDGRKGMAAVFDGIEDKERPATLLDLTSVEKVGNGTVWLRYTPKY